MKLYDAGTFIIIGLLGLGISSYSVFGQEPKKCDVWMTETISPTLTKSWCATSKEGNAENE